MKTKVNLRARIERHSRVLQHNVYTQGKKHGKIGITIASIVSVLLLPVYPSFASFVNESSQVDFYRGYIDESSIISSYFGDNNTIGDGDVFLQAKDDAYLSVNTTSTEHSRDVSASNEVIEYEVKGGESFSSIAAKFNISIDTIRWANDFDKSHTLQPGDTLKIPPVSGLIHTVKSGETLGGIAQKYDVAIEDIMRQNLLLSASDLKSGATIVVP